MLLLRGGEELGLGWGIGSWRLYGYLSRGGWEAGSYIARWCRQELGYSMEGWLPAPEILQSLAAVIWGRIASRV